MLDVYRRIVDLLNARERRVFVALICMTVAMGVLDMLGIASVLPFLAVLADPSVVERSALLDGLRVVIGADKPMDLLMALAGVIFVAVLVGVCARAATFYALTRFTKMRVPSLGARLLERHLAQPYDWFLNRNTADLGTSLLAEVAVVVEGPVDAAMRLVAHGAIAVSIAGLLIYMEPAGALVAAAVACLCYGAVLILAHHRLARLGIRRAAANRQRFQIAQEAFGGIKEVKVLGLESAYLRRFREPARRMADAQARAEIFSELPRHALEGIAIGGMLAFVLWLLAARGGDLEAVLPVLGAYAFAGARLFPELQQVFRSLTRIRFGRSALEELHAELRSAPSAALPEGVPATPLGLTDKLVLRDVVYSYPEAARPSLGGLSLEVEANTTVGIVGATGAGKTTVVDVILGLLTPQSGEMAVDGVRVDGSNVRRWRRSIGYVPQSIYLTDDTLAANIAFGVEPAEVDDDAVERAARIASLDDVAARLPEGFRTLVGERGARLSGGQRQRVGIARALYRDPDILIFDEATSALDAATERAVMEAVERLGRRKTIILIAHRLSTVRRCDKILMMEDGRVVGAGTYDELVGQSPAFRRIHEAAS